MKDSSPFPFSEILGGARAALELIGEVPGIFSEAAHEAEPFVVATGLRGKLSRIDARLSAEPAKVTSAAVSRAVVEADESLAHQNPAYRKKFRAAWYAARDTAAAEGKGTVWAFGTSSKFADFKTTVSDIGAELGQLNLPIGTAAALEKLKALIDVLEQLDGGVAESKPSDRSSVFVQIQAPEGLIDSDALRQSLALATYKVTVEAALKAGYTPAERDGQLGFVDSEKAFLPFNLLNAVDGESEQEAGDRKALAEQFRGDHLSN